MTRYFGLIPAAGTSTRFNSDKPKQYHVLDDQTIIERSVSALLSLPELTELIVVLHPCDLYWNTLPLAQHPKIKTTQGGASRMASVVNGLKSLTEKAAEDDWILVHDAARPYLQLQDIQQLIMATKDHPVGGILAAPIVDTLKFSTDGKTIEKTMPRAQIYRALTPQCFRFGKLFQALLAAQEPITDEAMALEQAGYESLLVLGNPANKKVTYPEDLF